MCGEAKEAPGLGECGPRKEVTICLGSQIGVDTFSLLPLSQSWLGSQEQVAGSAVCALLSPHTDLATGWPNGTLGKVLPMQHKDLSLDSQHP